MARGLLIRFVIISVAFSLTQIRLIAQSSPESIAENWPQEGISAGFNYHLQISHLDVAPIVVFPIHKRVHLGFGLNYLYYYRNSERVGMGSIGANVFSRAFITRNVYSHLEYLYSDVAYLNRLIYEFNRVRKADIMVGGGYRQPISDKLDGFLTLLVNLNKSSESPYENLILFKVGLTF